MKLPQKVKFKKITRYSIIILGIFILFFLTRGNIGNQIRKIRLAIAKSENQTTDQNENKQYGNCNYYVVVVGRVKTTLMRDLGISSKEELANFLEDLKNNPEKRKEFEKNKKDSSFNISMLTSSWNNEGQKYPSDLENYTEAANQVCNPNGKEYQSITTDIEVIKILAKGLKTYEIPVDNLTSIWSKDYLEGKKVTPPGANKN